jgi:hypothetical protein
MIDELFTWLTMSMSETYGIALLAAFGWGIVSILLSPCHLSSIPLVIGYISSQGQEGMKRSYSLSLVFGIGILITIALIGTITASAGRMMGDVGVWGNIIVAGVFFIVGLYLMDVINLSWKGIIPKSSRVERSSAVRPHLWHRAWSVHVCLHGAGTRLGVHRSNDKCVSGTLSHRRIRSRPLCGDCSSRRGSGNSAKVPQLDRPFQGRTVVETMCRSASDAGRGVLHLHRIRGNLSIRYAACL